MGTLLHGALALVFDAARLKLAGRGSTSSSASGRFSGSCPPCHSSDPSAATPVTVLTFTLPGDGPSSIRVSGAGRGRRLVGAGTPWAPDERIMDKMKAEGKIRTHPFTERPKLLELVAPVKVAFAKEAGAGKALEALDAVK
jgi:hypothetical protein